MPLGFILEVLQSQLNKGQAERFAKTDPDIQTVRSNKKKCDLNHHR